MENLIRKIFGWIVDVVVVLSLAWFCHYAFATQIVISGQSMTPLLEAQDVVLMNRLIYDYQKPERFDVVIFERNDEKQNVKRVIALPGETVQIIEGKLYIDGSVLEAPNQLGEVSLSGLAENPITLGEKEYFLLGDNRDSSEDSRFSNFGNVKEDQIIGKIWLRIFPLINLDFIST